MSHNTPFSQQTTFSNRVSGAGRRGGRPWGGRQLSFSICLVMSQPMKGCLPGNHWFFWGKTAQNGEYWHIWYIYIYTYVDKYNVNIWVKLWHMACYVSSSISWVHKYITYIYIYIWIYIYIYIYILRVCKLQMEHSSFIDPKSYPWRCWRFLLHQLQHEGHHSVWAFYGP